MKLHAITRIDLAYHRRQRGLYRHFRADKKNPYYLKVIAQRIGLHEAMQFRDELMSYLRQCDEDVILDMRNLDYLDAAGIAVLLEAEALERSWHHHLVLRGLKGKVRDVLGLSRVERVFKTQKDTQHAPTAAA
jgi:anti-anti-sigma factor